MQVVVVVMIMMMMMMIIIIIIIIIITIIVIPNSPPADVVSNAAFGVGVLAQHAPAAGAIGAVFITAS